MKVKTPRAAFLIVLSLLFLHPLRLCADMISIDYHPADTDFWATVDDDFKKGSYQNVLSLAEDVRRKAKKDSLEYAEAEMATGLAVSHMNFSYAATRILGETLKTSIGTDVGQMALSGIEEIARSTPVDEDYVLGEVVNDLEFDAIAPGLQDFVSFEQGLFNERKGYAKWADADFKKITEGSYWDLRLNYIRALEDVAHDQDETALEKFKSIAGADKATDELKTSATHQQARLIFEKGDYAQAYKIFKQVKLNPREKGLILLERAWAKYYEKDYSKALGLLAALEAPYFDTARSPEPYILKMVIYKELCYYDAALNVVNEFNKNFGASLAVIKWRGALTKDQMLVNLAVIDQGVEKWVNFFNLLKDERAALERESWRHYGFLSDMKRAYDLEISEIRAKLDWILRDKSREVADQLLDWQEQITFLDYQTRLDSLRVIKPKSELPYKSEEISHTKFDKIYWQRKGEIWLDELEDYKVFVESQCEGNDKTK